MTMTRFHSSLGVLRGALSATSATGSTFAGDAQSRSRLRLLRAVPGVLLLSLLACTSPDATVPPQVEASPPVSALSYRVRLDPDNPRRLAARLDLSGQNASDRTAFVRGIGFGLSSQVTSPACDGTALAETAPGQWKVPEQCSDLSWSIEVEDATANEVDSSRQTSLYFPSTGWWLLSEPTSLLRLDDTDDDTVHSLRIEGLSGTDSIAGATQLADGSWRLPPIGSAPEFFAFGTLSLQNHELGRMRTTYVIDDVDRFQRLPLLDMHSKALSYLADVFQVPPTLPERDRHLLVVWLGIDEARGEAGGAAGSRSFLANYIDGDEENLALNAARTMLVIAHEQAHQLNDLMWQGGPPGPTWLGESLAHYYGLMALARSGLPEEVIARPMNAFIDVDRPVEVGLIEYNRRYIGGDQEAYGMFYAQGATFWAEADRILRSGPNAHEGLDALIPAFLRSTDSAGDGLPESFRTLLIEHGGAEMDALIKKFVGE